MSPLNRTRIEYGTHSWPLATGCAHTPAECPTAATCWARTMAHRFHRDFTPALHYRLLEEPWTLREPSRILVSFSGDMFGDFWQAQTAEHEAKWDRLVRICLEMVAYCPQHSFLFLTKAPQNLALFNPWPDNAWVGMSVTGAETLERQGAMLQSLTALKGGHLWVSYEPMLGRPRFNEAFTVEWIVMGAQTGTRAVKPQREWLDSVKTRTERWRVPLWEKNNLAKVLGRPLTQQFPEGMVKSWEMRSPTINGAGYFWQKQKVAR